MLYTKNAKIYIAARSQAKALSAISSIKASYPQSTGSLSFLHLDLADLSTIKASGQEFLSKEPKLHVLFNDAGVMLPTEGSKTAQGYEQQLGVNNVGTFMFTKLLTPTLERQLRLSPKVQ
jgi:NAD(P)-dependent dehydrogenase (short-subunit alcohol dehydrogenase family)